MSNSKEKQRRLRKAFEKGQAARVNNVPLKSNPYTVAAFGIGEEWARGWRFTDEKFRRIRDGEESEA